MLKDLVKRFGLDGKSSACTSMSTIVKTNVHITGTNVDKTLYKSMIGRLLYLIASRPNIHLVWESVLDIKQIQKNPI